VYRTCLFCNGDLGTNELVEAFPVGRRLAFDGARGRLWVVCGRCARWNLTPLEERWEAIERCEQLYSSTRRRFSTDNIGLARLSEGLELVRIGEPQRPEFASWRYGSVFAKRRRRSLITYGVATGLMVTGLAGGGALVASLGFAGSALLFTDLPIWLLAWRRQYAAIARITTPEGAAVIRGKHAGQTRLLDVTDATCSIRTQHSRGESVISGDAGMRVLGKVLAAVNREGASLSDVRDAVRVIEQGGGPLEFMQRTARERGQRPQPSNGGRWIATEIGELGLERFALEMALHETTEQAALGGELAALELAWRDAEETAAIADDLLLPPEIDQAMKRLRVD
jgi:hypothetical protein